MEKQKKIAFIYDAIYPFVVGGGEMRFYQIGRRLTEKGYDVHFYGIQYWEGSSTIVRKGMTYHGIMPKMSLYSPNGKRSIPEAILFGLFCFKLFKEDFDIIDCSGFPYFSLFTCKIVCLLKQKKLYSTWHEVWGKEYWGRYIGILGLFGYYIERLASKLPDTIICVSSFTKKRMGVLLGRTKCIEIVPNGIDILYIESAKKSKDISDVIFIGRLLSYKNVDILIQAIGLVKQVRKDISCFIIGDGPEKERLMRLTKELGLTKNIRFFGFIPNALKIYSLIKSSKLFVLPSSREGFGIIALEANACGIPVLTVSEKDNATVDFVRTGKNGFISLLDPQDISRLILKIMENPNLRTKMAEKSREQAKMYNWDRISEELKTVYSHSVKLST